MNILNRKSRASDYNDLLDELDPNKTGFIEFKDYIKEMDDSEDMQETLTQYFDKSNTNFYKNQKAKWNFVSNNNAKLDHEKFYSFIYSQDFPLIQNFEIRFLFNQTDANKDGLLSYIEFKKGELEGKNTLFIGIIIGIY